MLELLSNPALWLAVSGLLMPVLLLLGNRRFAVAHAISDTPTSRLRSAAQGYVAMGGVADALPGTPDRAPLTQLPSVWWFFEIEERYRGDDRRDTWRRLASETSEHAFLLRDAEHHCVVNPAGAMVYPAERKVWYGSQDWPAPGLASTGLLAASFHRFRYTEHRIALGSDIHVMGEFRTNSAAGRAELEHEVSDLLRRWKSDQEGLLRRFDDNRDGVISAAEWEAARRVARDHVQQELSPTPHDAAHSLGKSADGRPYLIAAVDPRTLARRARWQAYASWAGVVLAAGVFAWLLRKL